MTTFGDRLFHQGGVPVGSIGHSDGNVYWVDPGNGSDGNDGLGPESDRALASMTQAVSLCTDDQGDTIVRLPGSETPSAVIEFNKAGITVISSAMLLGYGTNPYEPEKFSTYPAAGYATGPMAIVTAPTTLIGLEFVTRNPTHTGSDACTTASASIAVAGEGGGYTGGFCHFYRCRFVDWWGADYGVLFRAGAYNMVEECTFEGFDSGIAFRGSTSNNPVFNRVYNCHFVNCTNGIEHLPGTPQDFVYKGNTFVDYTDAIDFNNQGANGLVCGNYYETATDAATYDITVAAAQAHGVTFSGNHYSE